MARRRVVIEGDEELRELLESIVDGVEDLRDVGTSAAKLIADRAYAQAPEQSGGLKADIRTYASKQNAGVRVGRKRIPYAGPIVGGHGSPRAPRAQGGYVLPNPFIYDAGDERAEAVFDAYHEFTEDLVAGRRPKSANKYRLHENES